MATESQKAFFDSWWNTMSHYISGRTHWVHLLILCDPATLDCCWIGLTQLVICGVSELPDQGFNNRWHPHRYTQGDELKKDVSYRRHQWWCWCCRWSLFSIWILRMVGQVHDAIMAVVWMGARGRCTSRTYLLGTGMLPYRTALKQMGTLHYMQSGRGSSPCPISNCATEWVRSYQYQFVKLPPIFSGQK